MPETMTPKRLPIARTVNAEVRTRDLQVGA